MIKTRTNNLRAFYGAFWIVLFFCLFYIGSSHTAHAITCWIWMEGDTYPNKDRPQKYIETNERLVVSADSNNDVRNWSHRGSGYVYVYLDGVRQARYYDTSRSIWGHVIPGDRFPTAGTYNVRVTMTGRFGSYSCYRDVIVTDPAPTVSFDVQNVTDGTATTTSDITIDYSDQIAFNWSSADADSCTGYNFSTGGDTSGTQTSVTEPSAGGSTTYTVSCTGSGGTASSSITVTKNDNQPTATLQVSSNNGSTWTGSDITIDSGDEIWLNWSSADATSCSGTNFTASGTGSTQTSVTEPTAGNSTTYTVTCTGPGGSGTDSLTVTTNPIPTASLEVQNFTSNPGVWSTSGITIEPSDEIYLQWSSTDASSCSGSNFSTGGSTGDTQTSVTEPTAGNSTTYTVVCSSGSVSANDSLTVTANAGTGASISACSDTVVHSGTDISCDWDVGTSDPATCEIRVGNNVLSGYAALPSATGSFNYTVDAESTFTLDCESGVNTDTQTVVVLPEFMET